MKPMPYKQALSLMNRNLLNEESLAAGIKAGIISPPISSLRDHVPDRGQRISILLKELKPFKPTEFSTPKADD